MTTKPMTITEFVMHGRESDFLCGNCKHCSTGIPVCRRQSGPFRTVIVSHATTACDMFERKEVTNDDRT